MEEKKAFVTVRISFQFLGLHLDWSYFCFVKCVCGKHKQAIKLN